MDKLGMVLSFVAVIIICIVVGRNYNFDASEKVYAVDEYYTAKEFGDRSTSEKELYAQMTGAKTSSCPVTTLSSTENGTLRISIYTQHNNWVNNNFFVPNNYLGLDSSLVNPRVALWDTSDGENRPLTDLLGLNTASSAITTSGDQKINDLFTENLFAGVDYIEIVSPFTFTFDNVNTNSINTDGYETIAIINSTGNIRITFSNVANWFCAGSPSSGEYQSGTVVNNDGTVSARVIPWYKHGNGEEYDSVTNTVQKFPHTTIIGNTANASVRGGSAGFVIGYAHYDTTFRIEKLVNGTWVNISFKEWIYPDA